MTIKRHTTSTKRHKTQRNTKQLQTDTQQIKMTKPTTKRLKMATVRDEENTERYKKRTLKKQKKIQNDNKFTQRGKATTARILTKILKQLQRNPRLQRDAWLQSNTKQQLKIWRPLKCVCLVWEVVYCAQGPLSHKQPMVPLAHRIKKHSEIMFTHLTFHTYNVKGHDITAMPSMWCNPNCIVVHKPACLLVLHKNKPAHCEIQSNIK